MGASVLFVRGYKMRLRSDFFGTECGDPVALLSQVSYLYRLLKRIQHVILANRTCYDNAQWRNVNKRTIVIKYKKIYQNYYYIPLIQHFLPQFQGDIITAIATTCNQSIQNSLFRFMKSIADRAAEN